MNWLIAFVDISGLMLPILENIPLLRGAISFLLVFFLPGFCWVLLLFPKTNKVEKTALAFGLSIVIVTLSIVGANIVLGLRINGVNSLLMTLLVSAIPLLVMLARREIRRRRQPS